MTLFILGLVQTASWGWLDRRTVACLSIGLVLPAFLLRRSTRVERLLIDPHLPRYRNIRLAISMSIGSGTWFFATCLGIVLFLTQVWHYRVVGAGALIIPIAASVTVVAPFAGRIADRYGHRVLVVPGGVFWLDTLVTGTTEAPSIAPFRHLFRFMAVSGVVLSGLGTLIRTSPSHAVPHLPVRVPRPRLSPLRR